MKPIICAMLTAILVSCGIEEVGRQPGINDDEIWVRPGTGGDERVIYMTTLEYPKDYNWKKDNEKGSVKCSLVVYANGLPLMKVPVGDAYETSSDPDMHRMLGDHLYTDYSTEEETIIKKDGKEIFRYQGTEAICDMVEIDGDIYTLGHYRYGDGFAYRKNGEIILERKMRGRSFGKLYHDGDSLCFAFYERILSQNGSMERYYRVTNGQVQQTAIREDIKKVWDIVSYNDTVTYVASLVGVSSPVLFHKDLAYTLDIPENATLISAEIMAEADNFYIKGMYEGENISPTSIIWDNAGKTLFKQDGMTISAHCLDEEGLCLYLNGSSFFQPAIVYRCGETFTMSHLYSVVGNNPIALVDGILHIGLSSVFAGDEPILLRDNDTTTLNINGYISTISSPR